LNILSYVEAIVIAIGVFEILLLVWLLVSMAIIPRPKEIKLKAGRRNSAKPSAKLTLNVGCGGDTWGDVRVDIGKYSKTCGYGGRTRANTIASAQQLPFQDCVFREARAHHVLEHIPNPQRALDELVRVSDIANVKVPVNNGYSMLIEFIALSQSLLIDPRFFPKILAEITRWPRRYSDHRWYITFEGAPAKRNTLFGIPRELETVI
jgi:hypothetical protein